MKKLLTPQERLNDTGREVDELSFVSRGVRCGKQNCHRCPHYYWYAHWREGTVVKVKYIGKELPEEASASWREKHNDKQN